MDNKELHEKFANAYKDINEFLKIYYENFRERKRNKTLDLTEVLIYKIEKAKEECFGLIADDLNNR